MDFRHYGMLGSIPQAPPRSGKRQFFRLFNDDGINAFVLHLSVHAKMEEKTVQKHYLNLRWFINWAIRKGYAVNREIWQVKPKFKVTEKPVIFLTKDELKMFEFIGEGERAGSGVDTIKKGWASNKWPKPVIRELYDPEQVELTLYLGSTTTKTTTTTIKTTTKEQILHLIEANPSISISEIAEKSD